jgi:hypothetical protein
MYKSKFNLSEVSLSGIKEKKGHHLAMRGVESAWRFEESGKDKK